MSALQKIDLAVAKNDEYYEAINMQAAVLLPAISKKINAFIKVNAQPLIEMPQIAEAVQDPLLKLLNVVHPSCNLTFERQADGTLNLRVVKQPKLNEAVEEKGNIQNEQKLKEWVEGFGLIVLDDKIERGKAMVNINQFTSVEHGAIVEIVKKNRPDWKISLTQWNNLPFLTAEKHKWQEMDYRLNGVTRRAVLPTFVRGDVEKILLAGQDRANLEFDNIDKRDLALIIKLINETHADWQCATTTKKMGQNEISCLEIRNPAAAAIRGKRLAEMVDKIELNFKDGRKSTEICIENLTAEDKQMLTDLIQKRIPNSQFKEVTKMSGRMGDNGEAYLIITN